jgi:cytochrome c oxidase subunit 4
MSNTAHAEAHGGHGNHGLSHVASVPSLLGTFGLLVVLTFVTVWVAKHPLGAVDIWVAMGIATVKATAVGLYFMHLRHDSGFNRLVFLASFLFVFIFIGFAMMDRGQYDPTINWHEALPKFQTAPK